MENSARSGDPARKPGDCVLKEGAPVATGVRWHSTSAHLLGKPEAQNYPVAGSPALIRPMDKKQ